MKEQAIMAHDTIYIREKVIEAVSISLALDPAEISEDARLIDDLGMDSLDFLDITFMLEKALNMKIRDKAFDRFLRPERSEASQNEASLTEEELEKLVPIMPALKAAAGKRDIPRNEIFSFVTLETLIRLITRKLEQ